MFIPNQTVQNHLNVFLEKINFTFSPISKSFIFIKEDIELELLKTSNQINAIGKNKTKEVTNDLLDQFDITRNSLINTLNNLKEYVYNKAVLFEKELIVYFFPGNQLRALNSLNSPNQLQSSFSSSKELRNAIDAMKTTLNKIKESISDLSCISEMNASYNQYKTRLTHGLKIMKGSFNQVIDKFPSLIDESVIQQITLNIDANIDKMKEDISSIHFEKVKNSTDAIITSFTQTPEIFVNKVLATVKNQIDIQHTNLLSKTLEQLQPQEKKKEINFPEIPILKTMVPLFGIPLIFGINFAYGFHYGIKIFQKDYGIYLSVIGGGYAEIEARAYINLLITDFGGRITGLLGKGDIAISPHYSIKSFKVNLHASVFLIASRFSAAVFITYPTIEKNIICWGITFKTCITIPKITKKTAEYDLMTFEGKEYKKDIIKSY